MAQTLGRPSSVTTTSRAPLLAQHHPRLARAPRPSPWGPCSEHTGQQRTVVTCRPLTSHGCCGSPTVGGATSERPSPGSPLRAGPSPRCAQGRGGAEPPTSGEEELRPHAHQPSLARETHNVPCPDRDRPETPLPAPPSAAPTALPRAEQTALQCSSLLRPEEQPWGGGAPGAGARYRHSLRTYCVPGPGTDGRGLAATDRNSNHAPA